MNILFMSNASGYGGSERTLEIIIKELSNTNNITVYAENEIHIKNLMDLNIKVIKSEKSKNIYKFFKQILCIKKQIAKADGVISNTNKAAFYLSLISIFLKRTEKDKFMIFVRDFQWKFCGFIFYMLKRSRFYVASPAVIDYLAKYKTVPKIIPNPVAIPNVVHQYDDDLSSKVHSIVCPAMISRWKGIDFLIKAVAKVNKKCDLYIIGKKVDNDYFLYLEKEAAKIKNGSCVHFVEYTAEISRFYTKADIIVNTSISKFGGPETFGRTIVEAWSFKKPVIAFSCGGPKFLIDNYKNGLLVEEENVDGLVDALNILLEDKFLASRFGEDGYEKVKNEFSADIIAKKILNEIRNI